MAWTLAVPALSAPSDRHDSVIQSDSSVTAVAACFRQSADFASFAYFMHDTAGGTATYRLRFDAVMLEEIRFLPNAGTGSRVEIALSDQYSRRDRAAFRISRGNALARCASSRIRIEARAAIGGTQ